MSTSLILPFISVLALALLLQAAAEHWMGKHNFLPQYSRPIAAWGLTALSGYGAFWAYLAALWLGWAYTGAIHIGVIVYWVWQRHVLRTTFIGSSDGHLCRFSLVLIGACYLGLLCLWQSDQPLESLAANRFLPSLPSDNTLPSIIADRLATDQSPKGVLGDWLSSDRPPLQTGFILLLRLPLGWMGNPGTRAFAASMLFQLLWIPGLWALLRSAGARRAEALSAVGLVACTGFCLLHSIYTWPKLCAAGLVMGGASLLLEHSTSSRLLGWITGAALCALGYLAHGGVMFSLLALAPLTLLMRPTKTMLAMSFGVFLLIIIPWSCYQKFYDPPGNRLLKWHVGGVIPIDNRGTLETIYTSYLGTSWPEMIKNKQANMAQLFQDGPWHLFDLSQGNVRANRAAEFFHFFRGLGLGGWVLLLLPLLSWRLHADKASTGLVCFSGMLIGWMALTLLSWILLMFGPGTTVIHQGTLAPLLVLWTLPIVVLARWWRGSLILIAITQVTLLITIWAPPWSTQKSLLSIGSLALTISCAFLLVFLIISIHRNPAIKD